MTRQPFTLGADPNAWDPARKSDDRSLAEKVVQLLIDRLGVFRAVALMVRQAAPPCSWRDGEIPQTQLDKSLREYLVSRISARTVAYAILTDKTMSHETADYPTVEQWHHVVDDVVPTPHYESVSTLFSGINSLRADDTRLNGPQHLSMNKALDIATTLGLPPLAVFREIEGTGKMWGLLSDVFTVENVPDVPSQLTAVAEDYFVKSPNDGTVCWAEKESELDISI